MRKKRDNSPARLLLRDSRKLKREENSDRLPEQKEEKMRTTRSPRREDGGYMTPIAMG